MDEVPLRQGDALTALPEGEGWRVVLAPEALDDSLAGVDEAQVLLVFQQIAQWEQLLTQEPNMCVVDIGKRSLGLNCTVFVPTQIHSPGGVGVSVTGTGRFPRSACDVTGTIG